MNSRQHTSHRRITVGGPRAQLSQYLDTCPVVLYELVLYVLLNLSSGSRVSWAFRFGETAASELRNGKCFAWKCLARKWRIKRRKLTKALRLARFFKTQKPIGCATTARDCRLLMDFLPRPGHTHVRAWKWSVYYLFIFLFTFFFFFFGVVISSWA